MSTSPVDPNQQREFRCDHCQGLIRIPLHLPPTSAPCPHCGETITSPGSPAKDGEDLAEQVRSATPFTEASAASHDHAPQEAFLSEEHEEERRRSLVPVALVCLVVAIAVTVGILLSIREADKQSAKPTRDPIVEDSASAQQLSYIQSGWKREAYQVLKNFIQAKDAASKMPWILNADQLSDRIQDFYRDSERLDSNTPAEIFSVYELPEADRHKGIFMLTFDQPPQLDMRNFFRPVATLEVQYGLTEADILLSSMALMSNFAMEPMRVHAFFLKTEQGLKLDWEVFVQTKHRLLRNFLETREIGKPAIFRVAIGEDVAERGLASSEYRTYRVTDPAHGEDEARILVAVDSATGDQLSPLNWINVRDARPHSRTATVELEWQGDAQEPRLTIKRFLCWEFLGLGGVETQATAAPHPVPHTTPTHSDALEAQGVEELDPTRIK